MPYNFKENPFKYSVYLTEYLKGFHLKPYLNLEYLIYIKINF